MTIIKDKLKQTVNVISDLYKHFRYAEFNEEDFRNGLINVGIEKGDSLYLMCSSNNIKRKSGRTPPLNLIVNEILQLIGSEGTIMVLSFPLERESIIKGESEFHWKKSMSSNGMVAELIRRKKGSERSLNPIYSAVAYGKNAVELCKDHHKSAYPFGELSPYRKIINQGGKYLGIGVGFEAFTLVHVVDDYYKSNFKHALYQDVKEFKINAKDEELVMKSYFRKTGKALNEALPNPNGGEYFRKLQPLDYKEIVVRSGIKLFALDLNSFFKSAIEKYDKKKLTWWNTDV